MAKKKKSSIPSSGDTMLLVMTFIDTTWRLFIPTIVGTVIGLLVDNTYKTKPILTIVGVICGTILAIYLVRRQLKGVKSSQ